MSQWPNAERGTRNPKAEAELRNSKWARASLISWVVVIYQVLLGSQMFTKSHKRSQKVIRKKFDGLFLVDISSVLDEWIWKRSLEFGDSSSVGKVKRGQMPRWTARASFIS